MKNYIIYDDNGEIKRQVINLNEFYPIGYAMDKLPEGAQLIAKIIQSDTFNKNWQGHATKFMKSGWFKHAFWTSYYPNDNKISFKDAILYHENQAKFKQNYLNKLNSLEKHLLGG